MNQNDGRSPQNFISFPGKIHLIQNDQDFAAMNVAAVNELGFDTETKPSFRKGEVYNVAMVQLATDTDAYLIRLHHVTRYSILKEIFENKEIIKVGVGIRDDLKFLQKTFRFVPQGFVELQDLAKTKGLKNFGLKGMTEEVLAAPLTKGPKLTNWEASVLTDRQQMYAATDAWVGLAIFRKLRA